MISHIRCMIIDDDELDRLVLQHYIKQYENIEIAGSFDTAEKAVPYLDLPIDLLLTETNLKGMSGLEFRKLAHKIPACIFVSSHPELAAEVFEINALDFISKPLTSERFHYSMQKLFNFFEVKRKMRMLRHPDRRPLHYHKRGRPYFPDQNERHPVSGSFKGLYPDHHP